jgi:hypothetical protein
MSMGAEINRMDDKLKENLFRMNKDIGRMQIYNSSQKIYRLKKASEVSEIFILNKILSHEGVEGTFYKSEVDDMVFKNLNLFEKVDLGK